jgi:hypothetical protein
MVNGKPLFMPNTNPQLTTENLNQLPQPASIRPEHLAPVIRINRVSINKTLTGIWPQALEKPVTLKEPEILDGAGLNSLAEDIREYKTASGDMIWAATDKGINYKDHNEDRVGVSPQDNMAVVADGMGGMAKVMKPRKLQSRHFRITRKTQMRRQNPQAS